MQCRLIQDEELKEKFNVEMRELESKNLISIDVVKDANQQVAKGVLVADGEPKYFLYADFHTKYAEHHACPSGQLRAEQGREVMQWYRGELQKMNPLGRFKGKMQTQQMLEEACKQVVTDRVVASERAALQQAAAAVTESAASQAAPEESSDAGSDILYLDNEPFPQLQAPGAKSKNKGKGKGSRKKKDKADKKNAKKEKAGSSLASVALSRTHDGASTRGQLSVGDAESSAGSASKTHVPAPTKKEPYEVHMDELDLDKLLSGQNRGRQKWQAENCLRKLRASEKTRNSAGCVLLGGKFASFEKAESLLLPQLLKLDRAKREQNIREVQEVGAVFHPFCRPGLLQARALEVATTDPLLLIEMLMPEVSDELDDNFKWDPLQPTLAGIGCSEADQGKMMQRFLISESLIPLVMQGEAQKKNAVVLAVCKMMLAKLAPLDLTSQPVLECARNECCEVAKAVLALTSPDMNDDCAELRALLSVKSGVKMLVKQATR